MTPSVGRSLDAEVVRRRAELELARAERAANGAERHERLQAAHGMDAAVAFHARMAAFYRKVERRHRISARLHSQFAARIGSWATQDAQAVAAPRFVGVIAADLGLPSAGIALFGPNSTMASVISSDALAASAQTVEFDLDEGPAHDVARSGRAVLASLADAPGQWPHYVPAVSLLGVRSVAAVPLTEATSCFGALTTFDASHTDQSAGLLTRLTAMADVVAHTLLLEAERVAADEGSTGLLLRDSDNHETTHQAAGMVAAQRDCPVEDALALIRARALTTNQRVDTIARQVVNRTLRFDDWPRKQVQ